MDAAIGPPVSLLAEITHRCPLHCLYCSNPVELVRRERELPTDVWQRVVDEAADLGVLQCHLSGGEPLLRSDLGLIVAGAARRELYTNLITSGIGLSESRARALRDAGLDAVQLSVQAADIRVSQMVAGGDFWTRKMDAAQAIRSAGLPLSLNVVLHRHNLDQVPALLELAASLGAHRVELANTQYYGWALRNRADLMPDREMLAAAEAAVAEFRRRAGRMDILWVIPDYYADFPKPCMNGWGRMFLTVSPDGTVLPCLAAAVIPGLDPPSIVNHGLRWIWYDSPAFNRFRGLEWMQEPCRSCPRRVDDFGGCRCQAYLLAGDPAATDPVCIYSPHHGLVTEAAAASRRVETPVPVYRAYPHPLAGID
jgi:PqqA peptide cyclase